MSKVVIYVANRGFALVSSRLILIERLVNSGFKVVAITSSDEYTEMLKSRGVEVVPVKISRGGFSLLRDLVVFGKLWSSYRKYNPVMVHHFHAKPIIFGTVAARLQFRKKMLIINTITGLGHAFMAGGVIKLLASFGYKMISSFVSVLIFQNNDDYALFRKNEWVEDKKCRIVVSSGVDLGKFTPVADDNINRPDSVLPVLMATRLLKQKGVYEYIELARSVVDSKVKAKFILAGELEKEHPDAVSEEEIVSACRNGYIDYVGYVKTMSNILRSVAIFVFPSYYREGVPRVVLEAAACGIPVVALDVPGTREAVVDGETGFLVPKGNMDLLEGKVTQLLEDSELRKRMGDAARTMIVEKFDIEKITEQYLDIYRDLGLST